MKIAQRIAKLRAELERREKPIRIERRAFGPCPSCGTRDERVYGRPCPRCGVVVERAPWPATTIQDVPGSTITPAAASLTADAMRVYCEGCHAVIDRDWAYCSKCGARLTGDSGRTSVVARP